MKKLLLMSLIFSSCFFIFGCVAKSKVSTGDNSNLERSQKGQTTQEEISKNSEELYSFTITVSDNRKLTVVLGTTQPEDNYFSVSKILIYDSEQLLQTLNIPSNPPVDDYAWDGLFVNKGYDVGEPDIRDVNFDGAEDFGLLAVSSYPQNVPYSYYIWNKEKDLFEYGFTLFGAASLEVDSAGKRLIETVHDATATYEVFYYYAPNGTLSTTSTEELNKLASEATLEDAVLLNESPAPTSEEEDQRLAFGKVLWDVYQRGILPDGKLLEYHTFYSMEAAEKNSFAVTDVDGDGQDELLIFWETASMAGMCGYVFGYDGGEIYEELSAFPSLRFYDNGIVEEDASHNQNLAGDFWPYFVYQYDAKSGVYQRLGGVDA